MTAYLLNFLFIFLTDIVNRDGGIINKFQGDGYVAVLGASFFEGDDRVNAVAATREIVVGR